MPFDQTGDWFPPTAICPSELHAPLPSGHPYQSLIPPFTKLTPGELLDKYYRDRRDRFDWTDPKGVLRNQMEVCLKHPDNVGAPIGSEGLIGRWERPDGLLAVPVPVPVPMHRAVSPLDGSQVVVEFRDRDQGGPSRGAHVAHLCGSEADPTRLQGAGDIVLDELRGSDVQLIIAWPGYRPEWSTIRVLSKNGGPLTRFDLAERVTVAYATFFRKIEKERLIPKAAGFYNIALHQSGNRRSDSLGVQFTQLHLVGFRNTIGTKWIADVEIV